MSVKNNRREFIQSLLTLMPVLAFLIPRSSLGAANGLLKEDDQMAKALNYCADAEKGKAKTCPTRKEKERSKQFCDNCQFYSSTDKDGKPNKDSKASVGKCQVLQGGLVKAKGWCNSWSAKV